MENEEEMTPLQGEYASIINLIIAVGFLMLSVILFCVFLKRIPKDCKKPSFWVSLVGVSICLALGFFFMINSNDKVTESLAKDHQSDAINASDQTQGNRQDLGNETGASNETSAMPSGKNAWEADGDGSELTARQAFMRFLAGDQTLLDPEQKKQGSFAGFLFGLDHGYSYEYTMMDLDGDGTEELIVQVGDALGDYNGVFHWENGRIVSWRDDEFGDDRVYLLSDGSMAKQWLNNFGGKEFWTVFRYLSNGEEIQIKSFVYGNPSADWIEMGFEERDYPYYEIDGVDVTKEEFQKEFEKSISGKRVTSWYHDEPEVSDRQEALSAYYALIHKAEEAIYDPLANSENATEYKGADGKDLFSPEIRWLFDGSGEIAWQNVGYWMQDMDGDGVEELFFGENDPDPNGTFDGLIYDMYTYRDHQVVHLLSGWTKSGYYLTENGMIAQEVISSAYEGAWEFLRYDGRGLELVEKVEMVIQNDDKRIYTHTTPNGSEEITEKAQKGIRDKYVYVRPKFCAMGPWWSKVEDLNGDGLNDYLINYFQDGVCRRIALYLRGKWAVYEHIEEIGVGFGDCYSVDLDGDGKKEILLLIEPHVNSMPLEEFTVLKLGHNGWDTLETCTSLPLKMTRRTEPYEIILGCDGYDQTISFSVKDRYDAWKTLASQEGNSFYEEMKRYYEFEVANAKAGAEIGSIMEWGIWKINLTEFDGRPCLMALQGIQGYSKEDQWGEVEIYFDYDAEGKIRILDLKFSERSVIR